jgi:hypothetical protein
MGNALIAEKRFQIMLKAARNAQIAGMFGLVVFVTIAARKRKHS